MPAVAAATANEPSSIQTLAATPTKNVPSLSELEDMLYELIDNAGTDPNLDGHKLEPIRTFLHEHARERKTHAQFVTLFEQYELPMQSERPQAIRTPLLDLRSRTSEPAPVVDVTEPLPTKLFPWPDTAHAAAAISRKPRFPWVWALGFAGVSAVMAFAASTLLGVRDELTQLRSVAAESTQRLSQLQADTEKLRSQIHDNSQSLERTERDTQLLLHNLTTTFDENSP
jgi:hypothetical protein